MKTLLHTLALTLLLVNTACSGDKEASDSYTHSLTDMVTYVGNDETTGNAVFELVGRDVSRSTMLLSNAKVPADTKPLQRIVLRYYPDGGQDGDAQRNVKVYGITRAITDSLRVGKADLSYYAMHPVKMRSAWRTGDFINLHCQVEYTGKNRAFMMLVDDATRNQDTVQCYLHHDLHTDTVYQWRECYASFNVGNVWKRTNCRTLRLHVNDNSRGDVCYDFDR